MHDFSTIDLAKMRTRGEGIKNHKIFANVLYEWTLAFFSPFAPLPIKHPCPFGWKEVERGSREPLGLSGDSLRVALTMEEEFAFPFRWLSSDVGSV